MKNLHFSCAIVLLLAYTSGVASSPLKFYKDGTVRLGKQKKTLQIYTYGPSLEVSDGIYFYGNKPMPDNTEVPMVGYLSNDLKQEKYWQFTATINEVFIYKNQVHILDYEGQIFVESGADWKKTLPKVSPRSHIYFKDSFLIACRSRSTNKQGKERGGCEAPEKKWSFALDWLDVPPKVCNQRLTLRVFNIRPPYHVVQFDMETGKELARKVVNQPVTDVCSVKFD